VELTSYAERREDGEADQVQDEALHNALQHRTRTCVAGTANLQKMIRVLILKLVMSMCVEDGAECV